MVWHFEIDAPTAGRSRKATIIVRDGAGVVAVTDKADLTALLEREKVAKRLAKRLGLSAAEVLQQLDATWAKALHAHLETAAALPVAGPWDAPKLTDLGNAQRLAAGRGQDLRHIFPWKKDLIWTGRVWAEDRTALTERWAKDTVRQLHAEAAQVLDDDKRRALVAHALRSEEAKHIRNMVSLARSEPDVPILPEELDRDPMLLNCGNGTLDLRSGQLRPHRRQDYLTKLCRVDYRSEAVCELWERFLGQIFPATEDAAEHVGDLSLIQFVQRFFGYCLSGDVSEQAVVICWGAGANGKSTLLNVILEVLGAGYAIKSAPGLLMSKKDAHPTEKADLFGRRLVACIETEEGDRLAEALVKDLTGGDRIRARRMREDFWEFAPTHKLILCTNHKPKIRGTDFAIWRRIRLVPFTATFPPGRQDKHLLEKLRQEYPGILAWLVRGCLDWQRHGLQLPESVRAATETYRSEQDLIAGFLAECCLVNHQDPSYRCKAEALYARFKAWCEASGEAKGSVVPSKRNLGEALTERDFERYTSNGTWYRGILLRRDDGDALPG